MKKKAMRQEIKLLTEENQQLRQYTLLAFTGIILSEAGKKLLVQNRVGDN
ncbi:hypothetical protein [Limosilactobacillus caviae]|nr:hypothetical protein [Limosilactobacillus caviae]MCD7124642.1 hypothetical protein [Limosilactobacillus caviae]